MKAILQQQQQQNTNMAFWEGGERVFRSSCQSIYIYLQQKKQTSSSSYGAFETRRGKRKRGIFVQEGGTWNSPSIYIKKISMYLGGFCGFAKNGKNGGGGWRVGPLPLRMVGEIGVCVCVEMVVCACFFLILGIIPLVFALCCVFG